MMTILSGHNLNGSNTLRPESMSLNLSERQSTATITVETDAPEIVVGKWIRDDCEPGKGIVWRVKSVETQYERKTRTIQLEHAINTLRDRLMFGEVTPKTITGNSSATTCTARQAVEYILSKQSDWVLGTFSFGSVSNPYSFNGDSLFNALETVSSSLEDCWWSYDFSEYPFTLNIKKRSESVGTELRMSRNIQTAKMTIDRSRMFTRFYPIGKNNLHISGNYVSKNTDIYGVVSKVETDQSIKTEDELIRWANERLENHAEPAVTVTVTALDLSRVTGESLDEIKLGRKCRMPLSEYGTIIEETITKISWSNKIADPESATVTLANIQEDVASIINNMQKSSGGGGRTAAKDAEEDHAWFVDTSTHVAMIAEACAGEGASEDWSRVASLVVDGDGIHQRVTQTQHDLLECYSLIDQTSTAIRMEIGNVSSQMYSFIEQTPEMIHAEVAAGVSGIAHSVIEQTATYIRTEVANAASAISQSVIEQTAEYIRTEVTAVASGVAWSVIQQTMTGIMQEVHRKSKVYVQLTDPNDGTNVLYEGDIWIKAESLKTWNENSGSTWNSQNAKEWRSKYGDKHYVWRNGAWVQINDTSTDVENQVAILQTSTSLAIVGRKVDVSGEEVNSKLEVTATKIRSEVNTAKSQLYSTIEQTATNIRSHVANEVDGLQSQIEQTASQISTSVSAAKSTLYSSIVQTATSIRSEVASAKSGLYSSIMQTSTKIYTVVAAAKSSLYTSIEQTATSITSQVVGKNGVISAINQTAEQIKIQAAKINLNGYVTTSMMSSAFQDVQQMTVRQLTVSAGGYMTFKGYNASWQSDDVGTSLTVNSQYGYVTAVALNTKKIYYIGR